ncbi:hypothetical protein A2U01_0093911, partial [Trifolium medium]|nr:hypothetical protein [Trifolium medium]
MVDLWKDCSEPEVGIRALKVIDDAKKKR